MLVNDNDAERDFLEQVLARLTYNVIAVKKGSVLSEQLLDHFPDVVFASTLGKNQKILTALAKIKEARGKPKVVFIRQERESTPLNADQKKVIDAVIYSPIDPFKLIEVLSMVTPLELSELRKLYNEMLQADRGVIENVEISPEPVSINNTKIKINEDGSKIITTGGSTVQKSGRGILIIDNERKQKYQEICNNLNKEQKEVPQFNGARLRELQREQTENVSEDPDVKGNRKHFLKTLFTMEPRKTEEE